MENKNRLIIHEGGNDFNYTDQGYVTKIPHNIRINKRPNTANPGEKFGNFTQQLFQFGENTAERSLNSLL